MIGFTYSVSEVHTHAYYAERAEALADCAEMDRLISRIPGGLLTPDALRELAPHFLRAAGSRPIELHSHCTIGLAPFVYMEGLRAGFRVLHTAVGAARARDVEPGRGDHAPESRGRGLLHRLDLEALEAVSEHFRELARERGLPRRAQEFDATYYRHQLAGGMVSTTQRMLEELRRPELFDEVLEEVARVRAEMGYPIIVTPVSQLVATQAVRNVIDGERWSNVSDETVRYFLGHYGDPAAPPDPEIADRVLSRPRAEELRTVEPLHLDGARARFGSGISDEELLLRLTMPEEQVEAMLSSPRAPREPRVRTAAARESATRARSSRSCPRWPSGRRSCTCAWRRTTRSWSGAVRLDDVRGFVFDVDGTLVHRAGDEIHVQPGAAEVLARIRASGRPLAIFTNGSHEAPEAFAAGLRGVGLDVADDELLTPLRSVRHYLRCTVLDGPVLALRDRARRTSTCSGQGMPLLDGEDATRADAVFVAHADAVDFVELERAARLVLAGARLLTGSYAPAYAGANGRS